MPAAEEKIGLRLRANDDGRSIFRSEGVSMNIRLHVRLFNFDVIIKPTYSPIISV